jgi:hypothetical protein
VPRIDGDHLWSYELRDAAVRILNMDLAAGQEPAIHWQVCRVGAGGLLGEILFGFPKDRKSMDPSVWEVINEYSVKARQRESFYTTRGNREQLHVVTGRCESLLNSSKETF